MLKLKTFFFLIMMLIAYQVSYADGPCPGSDPDVVVEDCTYEIQSGKLKGDRLAIAYTNRAEAWNEKGDFDKGMSDSNKALSLNPKYLDALNARGLAWQGKGEYDKAIADYSAVIKPSGSGGTLNWWLSTVYMRRGAAWGLKGDLEQCIVDSSEAIKLVPTPARAFYNRGLAWKLKGDYEKAIADYNEAMRLNPADPRNLKKLPKEWNNLSQAEKAEVLFKGLTFSGILSTSPEVSGVNEVQQTRFGNVLVVVVRKGSGAPDTILFNGRNVFESGASYLGFHAKYEIGDKDVLLFGINCGGSACSPDELNFLVLGAESEPKIVTTKDFYSADGTIKPRKEKDRVVIDLGFEKGKKKIAILESGKVVMQYTAIDATPMKLEDCQWLYENSIRECIQLKELKLDCEENGRNYSGGCVATMTGITALSNHPGFVSSALGDICVTACKTGKALTFEQFKRKVCSIK